jgi:hypothetical protein
MGGRTVGARDHREQPGEVVPVDRRPADPVGRVLVPEDPAGRDEVLDHSGEGLENADHDER